MLFTFYIQDVLKLKKNNSGAKRLIQRIVFLPRLNIIVQYFILLVGQDEQTGLSVTGSVCVVIALALCLTTNRCWTEEL